MKTTRRYRIQSVSEMTGVPAPTLRAWERRYGVPAPERTESAYRMYSDVDVAQVKRMLDLCEQGISPSEAARVVQRQVELPHRATPEDSSNVFKAFRRRLIRAVELSDAISLESAARTALLAGSATQIFEQVVTPVMHELGQRWHSGEISIAQEHLASSTLGSLSRELLRIVQPSDSARQALLSCVEGEGHDLALYGIGLRLAEWGYRAVVLGGSTPAEALAGAVSAMKPALVGLSMTIAPSDPRSSRQMLQRYAQACAGAVWLLGGRSAAALAADVRELGGIAADADWETLRGYVDAALAPLPRQ